MDEKKKKEELQSRRDFFKNAAKMALPIVGAIVLSHAPIVSKAAEEIPMGCKGCSGSCEYTCSGSCKNACLGCKYACEGSCKNACLGCKHTCEGSCRNACYTTCKGTASK